MNELEMKQELERSKREVEIMVNFVTQYFERHDLDLPTVGEHGDILTGIFSGISQDGVVRLCEQFTDLMITVSSCLGLMS